MKCSTRNAPKLIYFTPLPDVDSQWAEVDAAHDHADRLPRRIFVSLADLFCYVFAIATFVGDVVSDLTVAYYHWTNDRIWPASLVLTFVALPSLLLNAMAFAWWFDDSRL
uniref:XK-related protein n=1 Tax=Plectus sambesii TaxID=2011161 RepID=A0A914V4F4_9BILA